MLRSALRTLSVVTVLVAVTGAVVLLHRPGLPARTTEALAGAVPVDALLPGEPEESSVPAQPLAAAAPVERIAAMDDEILPHTGSLNRLNAAKAEYKVLEERRADARRERAAAERRAALVRAARDAARDPKAAAKLLLAERGWSGQFSCLESLWTKESNWNHRAENPSSGAYGIPQSLPGSKMASAGADWRTNPMTQITWGLGYIDDRYGTPCAAWGHSQSNGWY